MKILNEIIIDGQPMTCYLAERGANYEEANEAAKKIQVFKKKLENKLGIFYVLGKSFILCRLQ